MSAIRGACLFGTKSNARWSYKLVDTAFSSAARPERADLPAFSRLFSTYLTNTFDLDENG